MAASLKRSEDNVAAEEKVDDDDQSSGGLQTSVAHDLLIDSSADVDEKKSNKTVSDDKPDETGNESIECPVCLGPAVFPVRIPCGHVFCFLCVKGAARQANRCPMCRQLIPVDFDKNPDVLERQESEMLDDGYQWFYEGKNGWWQYEKRTSEEIEQNYKINNKKFDLLICGTIYTIDLERNVQYNKENPNRRRKVKRENADNIAVKGVAGVH